MSLGIELLPKDEVQLSPEDEKVLAALYAKFDVTSAPVDAAEVAFGLKGVVFQVPDRLQGSTLAPYVRQASESGAQGFVPTLRAAIRLSRVTDLQLAWDLYRACYAQFEPGKRQLEVEPNSALEQALPKLRHLLSAEFFATIHLVGLRLGVTISPSILDADSLAMYLENKRGLSIRRPPVSQVQRAPLRLDAIALENVRSFARATISQLGPLTVFAGPNEAGKSNLVRALEFSSRVATQGFGTVAGEWRDLRRLTEGTGETGIRLGLASVDGPANNWVYRVTNHFGDERSSTEELVHLGQSQIDFSRDGYAGKRLFAAKGQGKTIDDAGESSLSAIGEGESLLAGLQDLNRFRELIQLRATLGSWQFFHFEASALRNIPQGANGHLRRDGSNLAASLLSLAERDEKAFRQLAEVFASLLPQEPRVEVEPGLSGGAILRLKERGLLEPLRQVDFSDGMLRILALLALAFDPNPPALVVVEEPENGLYPRLIESMLDIIRQLSKRTQVILTTHSVTLLNRLTPEELVFTFRKDGETQLQRVDSRADIKAFINRSGLGTQMLQGNLEDQS